MYVIFILVINTMKVTGIVTEYNPFHYGHQYHIQEARKLTNCDVLIAVMSGNFVQRGEPAILDKWQRTKIALEHGVDLVLELPFIYCNQSAQQFADGAIHILNLAKIDSLVFGSESNNLEELKEIASMSINVNNLKEYLSEGHSYPKSLGLMAGSYPANDILGIAYLKALQNYSIQPYSIQRTNQYHDSKLTEGFASATAIRHAIQNNQDVSNYTPMQFSSELHDISDYYPYLRTLLLTMDKDYLKQLFLFEEGIENHLIKLATQYYDYSSFINHATTRRYTKSRIQRTLISLLVQLSKEEKKNLPPLTQFRVLGFNSIGQNYLKQLRELEVPIATTFGQLPIPYRQLEYKATVAYCYPYSSDYQSYLLKRELEGPVIIK